MEDYFGREQNWFREIEFRSKSYRRWRAKLTMNIMQNQEQIDNNQLITRENQETYYKWREFILRKKFQDEFQQITEKEYDMLLQIRKRSTSSNSSIDLEELEGENNIIDESFTFNETNINDEHNSNDFIIADVMKDTNEHENQQINENNENSSNINKILKNNQQNNNNNNNNNENNQQNNNENNQQNKQIKIKVRLTREEMKERVKQRRRERAEKTKELPGGGRVNDAYAFTGMHHIWDEHHEPGFSFLLFFPLPS